MGRPWWPGGRPCGSRAAGDALDALAALAALAALNASTHWTHCTPSPSKARACGRGRGRRRHTAAQSAETLSHGRGGGGTRVPPGRCASTRSTPATSTSCLANHAPPNSSAALSNCTALLDAMAVDSTAAGFTSRVRRGRPEGLRAALRAARPARPPRAALQKKGRPEGPPEPGRRAARVGPEGGPQGRPAALTTLWNARAARKRAQGIYFCPFFLACA